MVAQEKKSVNEFAVRENLLVAVLESRPFPEMSQTLKSSQQTGSQHRRDAAK
jgi:hypothetical protein